MRCIKRIIIGIILLLSFCFVTSCDINIGNPNINDNSDDDNLTAYDILKESVLLDIDLLLLEYNEEDYYETEWNELIGIISDAEKEVNSLTTVAELASYSIPDLSDKLSKVKTKQDILNDSKEELLAEIDALKSNYKQENYYSNEWNEINSLVASAVSLINSYTNIAEINAYSLENLKLSIDSINTKEMVDAIEELNDIKHELITNIDLLASEYDESDYSALNWAMILDLIDNAKSLVNGYSSLAMVDSEIVNKLRSELNEIKTIEESTGEGGNTHEIVENITYDNFQVHFLRMGDESYSTNYSKYSGDSVYIKAGENDILIDAGSRQGSAGYIKDYVDEYCTDGKLEYVIATHADQDHIAGFIGTNTYPGIFESYEIDTLIDFALSDKSTTTDSGNDSLYGKYVNARAEIEADGTECYTAGECFNNQNGAQSTYILAEGISFTILYNYYYFNSSSDENNYSVCTLFTYNEMNFIFTGDLEVDGEEKLAEYYDGSTDAKTLPHCVLYKGGHHGSKTSSNEVLLSKITPEIVCVCCCAGSTEYTANYNNIFPTQDFITRVAKYTDRIYVTSILNETTGIAEAMNGDIIVSTNGTNIGLKASNNLIKLKDTSWFNEMVYIDSSGNICSGKGKDDFFTSATEGVTAVKRRIWPSTGVGA